MASAEPGTTFFLQQSQMPTSCITSIDFGPSAIEPILVASLDGTLRFFDSTTGDHVKTFHARSPCLCAKWTKDGSTAVVGTADGLVRLVSYPSMQAEVLSTCAMAVRCLAFHKALNVLFVGTWGGEVKAYDIKKTLEIGSIRLSGKIFAMDVSEKSKQIVVATSERCVHILELNKGDGLLSEVSETKADAMKFQIRSVSCRPDGQGYILSSTEGRVSWELFKSAHNTGAKPYAFKCHREKYDSGTERIWPVNCTAFHTGYTNTFATGGSDGSVSIWDGENRKKIWKLPTNFPTSISALSFDSAGTKLAMAASYDFIQGANPPSRHNTDEQQVLKSVQVAVRVLRPEEYMPKGKTA